MCLLMFIHVLSFPGKSVDISGYLPVADELERWIPVDRPEIYVGDDLFLFINGGAEIYHEYGFVQAAALGYRSKNGKSLNLELYEMTDTFSAYGVYSFKRGKNGKTISLGESALLEDYYLNFWKGKYVVTLVGFDEDQETLEGIATLARIVDKKIESSGGLPSILNLLPVSGLIKSRIKYLKGHIALYNCYEFSAKNLFGLREGAIGYYDNFRIFVFKYDNNAESLKWYKNAQNVLKESQRFNNYADQKNAFSVTDRKNKQVCVEPFRNYILIYLGNDDEERRKAFSEIHRKILEPFESNNQ